ncbi:MAG: type II toxin-antitoxin system VapC family toxin [Nitrospiraceae bacterium]|nr:type II toxin-antitoxin system VapC family toxin [Nitrospiraceae bacterium]
MGGSVHALGPDCSMVFSRNFPDESAPAGEWLRDFLVSDFALVPSLWAFEVGNVLRNATRRGRISMHDWLRVHEGPKALPIAHELDLTVYDAACLELSLRHGPPLATPDRDLREKAPMLGMAIVW